MPRIGSVMDRKAFGAALKRIREAKFQDETSFAKASGIDRGAVKAVEDGRRFLMIDRLEVWLKTCDTTLAQFFEQFEDQKKKAKKEDPRHAKLHDRLQEMLDADGLWSEYAALNVDGAWAQYREKKREAS